MADMTQETLHKHKEWLLAEDLIETDDGPPQPRGSVFLECISTDEPDCTFFLRDKAITDYIDGLVERVDRAEARLAEAELKVVLARDAIALDGFGRLAAMNVTALVAALAPKPEG